MTLILKTATTETLLDVNIRSAGEGLDPLLPEAVIERLDRSGVHVCRWSTADGKHLLTVWLLKYAGERDPCKVGLGVTFDDYLALPEVPAPLNRLSARPGLYTPGDN